MNPACCTGAKPETEPPLLSLSETEFMQLVAFVRDRYGINLEKKRELVISRLSFHIHSRGYRSYGEYLREVTSNPDGDECQRMIDRLSTNHTYFFREMECLKHFIGKALPQLVREGTNPVRIWCAAASSGQECYTIAMEMKAALSFCSPSTNFTILATDVNSEVLAAGERGVYPEKELANIPERHRRLYTKSAGSGRFEIAESLRRHVVWDHRNLMDPFSFPYGFDAVFCRNVMFYFKPETREALVPKFCAVLKPGGCFYVGVTESVDRHRRYFSYIAPSIYRKAG